MPRKPRFFIPGVPVHVVQRGNNRGPIFFADEDYRVFLDWLERSNERYGVNVHSYVLMTNHVHLLLSPLERDSISRSMQYLGRGYVSYINNVYGRTGTLWERRFRASLIDSESYLIACMRYIELNPVRAGIVDHPQNYRWSSYAANALGVNDTMIVPHAVYLALSFDENERLSAYRGQFRNPLGDELLGSVRAAYRSGTPLGNDRFRGEVEKILGVRVGVSRRGRPVAIKGL